MVWSSWTKSWLVCSTLSLKKSGTESSEGDTQPFEEAIEAHAPPVIELSIDSEDDTQPFEMAAVNHEPLKEGPIDTQIQTQQKQ